MKTSYRRAIPGVARAWVLILLLVCGARAEEAKLDLLYCLDAAMKHNRELIQARERIRQIGGERLFVRSRFVPQLDVIANYDALQTERDGDFNDHIASRLLFSQRLFEFGPDALQEVQLREDLRQALYDYQDKVYDVLARAWERVHLILLQDQQIATRGQSRASFQEILERQQARFEKRLASEKEVLDAELNVLSEDLAINSLERQQFNNKVELLRLIGRRIGLDLQLRGELAPFALDQNASVDIAIKNSVRIALSSERLDEQRRVAREVNWQYFPDISLEAGVEDQRRNAQLNLGKEGKTWRLNLNSSLELQENQPPSEALRDQTQWFARLEARIPLFEGGSRLGDEAREKARLRELQVQLRDLNDEIEVNVRQAYQFMLEAAREQEIQAKRVEIARRRLEVNQILQDKGQADESLLEQVRGQFFNEQDRLFNNQATFIRRQATLRRQMGFFE